MADQEQEIMQEVVNQDTAAPAQTHTQDDLNSLLSDPLKAREYIQALEKQVKEANGQAKNIRLTKQDLEKEVKELRAFKAEQDQRAEEARLAKLDTEQRLQEQLKAEQAKAGQLEAQYRQQQVNNLVLSSGIDPEKANAAVAMLSQSDLSDPQGAIDNLVKANPWLLKAQEKEVKKVLGSSSAPAPASNGGPTVVSEHSLSHLGVKRIEEKPPTTEEIVERQTRRGMAGGGSIGSFVFNRR
jgi:hypothetical protein